MKIKAASFLFGITIIGVILLIVPIPVNAQASPCTCKDRADLINQLNRANAAYSVVKYLYFQQAMGDHLNRPVNELLDGENPGNLNYKDVIDGELSDDVNAVNDPKASTIVIKTDASTCEPTVSASTACPTDQGVGRDVLELGERHCVGGNLRRTDRSRYDLGVGCSAGEVATH